MYSIQLICRDLSEMWAIWKHFNLSYAMLTALIWSDISLIFRQQVDINNSNNYQSQMRANWEGRKISSTLTKMTFSELYICLLCFSLQNRFDCSLRIIIWTEKPVRQKRELSYHHNQSYFFFLCFAYQCKWVWFGGIMQLVWGSWKMQLHFWVAVAVAFCSCIPRTTWTTGACPRLVC